MSDSTNLFTLIDTADDQGRIHFTARREPLRTKEQARDFLGSMFMDFPLLTVRLDSVKKAITEIDLEISGSKDATVVSVNLAKVLLLPSASPAAELAEFREMLVAMKAFFEAHETEQVDIQIVNNRDRNKRVFGDVSCRVPTGEHKMTSDEAATAALKARIDASPALSHWLRQVALSLGRLGPWSWTVIRSEELFGYGESPYFKWREKQPRVARAPEKLRVLDI
jgi:hypothetical protein